MLITGLTKQLCEKDDIKDLVINCGDVLVIAIESAFYGRNQPYSQVCDSGIPNPDLNCIAQGSEAKIRQNCEGESKCLIPANNVFFGGDPCQLANT